MISAANSSTDGSIVAGDALSTIIRAPSNGSAPTTTVQANNLLSLAAFSTELSGFTISSPLVGSTSSGPINTSSFGLLVNNSDVLIDRNYFVDSGVGIGVNFGGPNALAPRIVSNAVVGNTTGLILNDVSTTTFRSGQPIQVANNDFAYNTTGFYQQTNTASPLVLSDVVNNIFWQNADRTSARNGVAIVANAPNRMTVRDNLFFGNGPSEAGNGDDTSNIGGGFNPSQLSPTGDALGNFTGDPRFVRPIDPRPEGQGPGNFFLGADYDLQSNSAAIDNALNSVAPARDFKNRTRVDIANVGRPGYGPADVGAFEFNGSVASGTTRALVLQGSETDSQGSDDGAVTLASAPSASFAAPSTSTPNTVANPKTVARSRALAVQAAAKEAKAARVAKAHQIAIVRRAAAQPSGPIAAARRFFTLSRKAK